VLKVSRQANGMSQSDLAKIMQVSRTYISKIENLHATPTLSSLARFANALNASPFVLMAMCEGAATK
jgi:transcriptional regulator with XRE-family HTH domain